MTRPVPTPIDVKLMNMTASALFMVFASLLVGALAGWVLRHPVFAVRGIVVTGDVSHHNALTLRANVAPHLQGTFFTMDMGAAQQVFETLPWVRHAVVQREFPNRLRVVLEEHRAVAYWGADGESRLINSFGEVFEANVGEVEQEDLPRLNGPHGQAGRVLAMYQSLQPPFDTLAMPLDLVELTVHGGWRVRLASGAELELGGGTWAEALARTQQFLGTLTLVTSRYGRTPDALESADLRHRDGYAIRLDGVTTLIAGDPKKATK